MHQRINITLPKETIQMIDRIAKKGNRSALIDKAVRNFIESVGRSNLAERLKKVDPMRAARDLRIAEEWFDLGDND
jgi:metal-responsive CopG/Arc/MetJ family transcriptional regulator